MNERCPTCQRPYKKERSSNQNRYYWAVVVDLLSEHTGFTSEEIHDILKHKFLSKHKSYKEYIFQTSRSTTDLSTKEMEDYLSRIRIWASAELACYIPEPNEEDYHESRT